MGYGESLISGVHAGLAINAGQRADEEQRRRSMPRPSGMGTYSPRPEYLPERTGMTQAPPAEVDLGPTRQEIEAKYLADVENERKTKLAEGATKQAADYDFAVQAMQIGNMAGVEDYLKEYGNKNLQAKVTRGDNGSIIVTPQDDKGGMWVNGVQQDLGDGTAPAATPQSMVFKDAKEFYSKFFGVVKPAQTKVALPEAAKASDLKTVEVGAGAGMKTQAVLNPDGTTTPLGKPYLQFDPNRTGAAGGGDDNTAPIKNAKYLGELAKKNDRPGAIRYLTSNSLIRQKNDYVQDAVKSARESAAYAGTDEPFDAKQAEREAKQAWDDSVDEMLVSAGFPGKEAVNAGGMIRSPLTPVPPYNGPVRTGEPAGMAVPRVPVAPVVPAAPAAPAAAPAPQGSRTKPAPDVVISQARAALASQKIPREKIVARMEEIYPGLSKQL